MYKLPVKIDASVMSECWTYNKLAIIEASRFGREWLATHLDLYMDKYIRTWYGENNREYGMAYYADILQMQQIPFWQTPPEKIIATLLGELKQGNYVVVHLNMSPNIVVRSHEALVYGFDEDSKTIFYLKLNDLGYFEEEPCPFDYFTQRYADVYHDYKNKTSEIFERMQHFFPITRIRLREDYSADNAPYHAMMKLQREKFGSYTDYYLYLEEKPDKSFVYSGTQCIKGLENGFSILNREKQLPGETLWTMVRSLKKLYEHRKILLDSMGWLYSQLENYPAQTDLAIAQYRECCETMKSVYLMALKLYKTKDESIIPRLGEKITGQYEKERNALNGILENASRSYCAQISYDAFAGKGSI